MLRDKVFTLSFVVLLFLAAIHHVGIAFHWYYTQPYLDLITHFLGGLWVALVALWFVFQSGYTRTVSLSRRSSTLIALFTIFIIGALWEILEVWAGVPVGGEHSFDTVIDALMDVLGASLGLYLFLSIRKTSPLLVEQSST